MNPAFIDSQNLNHKKFASSLYKKLGFEFYDNIGNIKSYIEYKSHARDKKEKGS